MNETRGTTLGAASAPTATSTRRPLTIADLSHDVLVSVFAAVNDLRWVRHTVPFVCKEWNDLYRSEAASPLHERLKVDFRKEVEGAVAAAAARKGRGRRVPVAGAPPPRPRVHASRVLSWAWRRAGWVRNLHFETGYSGIYFEDFTAEDLGALVAVVGPSLTEMAVQLDLGKLCKRPFWRSLRTSVVPARRLRSFVVESSRSAVDESDVEPLGQLAASLEELVLKTAFIPGPRNGGDWGLPRFPESFLALTKLRRLVLDGHPQITAIPAEISSLKKLKDLALNYCNLSSLPKELGELSGLTSLDLGGNENLGNSPEAEAFPAELGRMKSLRKLDLGDCGLRTVPAFAVELKSLESLEINDNELSSLPKELGELSGLTGLVLVRNENLGNSPEVEAFPAELGKMKSLRDLNLFGCGLRTVPSFVFELKSLEKLVLRRNDLSSLPKELAELSGLTSLFLGWNSKLGNSPEAEAFPAELKNMKSLRELDLRKCGLRTFPAFVGELESLETLELPYNDDLQIDAPLEFLLDGCPCLRDVRLHKGRRGVPWTPESLAHLKDFRLMFYGEFWDSEVSYEIGGGRASESEFERESDFDFESEDEDEDASDESE